MFNKKLKIYLDDEEQSFLTLILLEYKVKKDAFLTTFFLKG